MRHISKRSTGLLTIKENLKVIGHNVAVAYIIKSNLPIWFSEVEAGLDIVTKVLFKASVEIYEIVLFEVSSDCVKRSLDPLVR